MAIINWTYRGDDAGQLTAREIADKFAADPSVWDQPRTIGWLEGHWLNREWVGQFELRNGVTTYKLTYTDTWQISA